MRTRFVEEKRHPAEELTFFPPKELREVEAAFDKRRGSKMLDLPSSDARIDFSSVKFDRDVIFEQYLFGDCSFQEAYFSSEAWFADATFSDKVIFKGTTFSGEAWYPRVNVSGKSDFAGARFSDKAWFTGATFSGGTTFGGATFSGLTLFSDATFSGVADFQGAKFLRTSSFVNAEMKEETSFESATFKTEPPKIFGAKLHQGTVWRGIKPWPAPTGKDEAGRFIDAYACLKLEMDRLKSMRTNSISSPSN
jgi:Pentapeptide repeats (9 copies)